MRIVMMGTGPFAVPTFQELLHSNHIVVALVTSPLRTHRGKEIVPISTMRDLANDNAIPIFDPENVNTDDSQIEIVSYAADMLVVCDYGQILSPETLACARLGGINLHGSLLPKYRGAAPINWALYNGDKDTGVTVIHMTPQIDAGPCIAQATISIQPEENAVELENRLSHLGAWLIRRTIDALEEGWLEALPQNPALASKAPRLKKSDGSIDWSRPALAIADHIRAFEPWPKTFTFWHRPKGSPVRLILGPGRVERGDHAAEPGTVLEAKHNRLVVAAGENAIALRAVQPSGKKMMPIVEFLNGHRVQTGERFGNEQ